MVYLTFLSAGWILRQKEHISMLFLYEHLEERNRKILDVVHSLLGFLVCLFLFWSGCSITRHALENNVKIVRPQYINIPKSLILWVIPFCFLIFLIYFARDFFNSLADLKTRINAKIQETTSGRVIEDDNFREDQ
jgi:TRAP-type C4-dicarboxylate transport system permease small subunit